MLIQPSQPVMVRVLEPAVESTGIADILIGAMGLTGAMLFAAILMGALLGGLLIGIKKFRARYDLEPVPDSESLRVTPSWATLTLTPAPRPPSSSSASLDT